MRMGDYFLIASREIFVSLVSLFVARLRTAAVYPRKAAAATCARQDAEWTRLRGLSCRETTFSDAFTPENVAFECARFHFASRRIHVTPRVYRVWPLKMILSRFLALFVRKTRTQMDYPPLTCEIGSYMCIFGHSC